MYHHHKHGSISRRGFTLVEMLVVLILIGLMAGLVAPALVVRHDDEDAVSRVRQLVRSASAASVKRGEVVRLGVRPSGNWELVGLASASPDPIASGRLDVSGIKLTLFFSPLGTCSPDIVSEQAAAAYALDPLVCNFRVAGRAR